MIDTNKYEGHTPGPWMLCCSDQTSSSPPRWITSEVKDVCGELTEATKPDAQLIADAPLLLQEVKSLRQELAQARECLWWCYDKERFGWEVDEEQWELIGRLLGADTDHNDNEWIGDEEE